MDKVSLRGNQQAPVLLEWLGLRATHRNSRFDDEALLPIADCWLMGGPQKRTPRERERENRFNCVNTLKELSGHVTVLQIATYQQNTHVTWAESVTSVGLVACSSCRTWCIGILMVEMGEP